MSKGGSDCVMVWADVSTPVKAYKFSDWLRDIGKPVSFYLAGYTYQFALEADRRRFAKGMEVFLDLDLGN